MDTATEPTKQPETDDEPSQAEDWHDEEHGDHQGGGDLLRSALPVIVGSVAVGIAAVAVVGVQLSRRRRSKTLLRRAAAHMEDARKALSHTAAGLPERGKAVVRRVHR